MEQLFYWRYLIDYDLFSDAEITLARDYKQLQNLPTFVTSTDTITPILQRSPGDIDRKKKRAPEGALNVIRPPWFDKKLATHRGNAPVIAPSPYESRSVSEQNESHRAALP
jgi:hypothetical protein